MPVHLDLEVNEISKTGRLQIFSGALPTTSYSFADNHFTVDRFDAVAMPITDIRANLADVTRWLELVRERLGPARGEQRPWDVLYDRPDGVLRFRFRMQGSEGKVSDATCDLTTRVVTIEERPQAVLTVREFERWLLCWHWFLRLCEELA